MKTFAERYEDAKRAMNRYCCSCDADLGRMIENAADRYCSDDCRDYEPSDDEIYRTGYEDPYQTALDRAEMDADLARKRAKGE